MKQVINFIGGALLMIALILGAYFLGRRLAGHPDFNVNEVVELIVIDTTKIRTNIVFKEEKFVEYFLIPVSDTVVIGDTTYIQVAKTQKVYEDSLYTAWVSGYKPSLDSINIYNRTKYITKYIEPSRWSLSAFGGLGATTNGLGGMVGVGLSYSIFNFQNKRNVKKEKD